MKRATARRARPTQEQKMPKFQGEVIRDARGREVVCFTTPSGVRAIVDTQIPPAALAKLIAKRMTRSEWAKVAISAGP